MLASLQIAYALREHKGKVTAFVPHYAMSGGTLIALAADEIVMCKHSVLGPVDPQLGQLPAASPVGRMFHAYANHRRRALDVDSKFHPSHPLLFRSASDLALRASGLGHSILPCW